MRLVIFANFFPYQRSEPFLKNEFEFSKKQFESISLFTLYGKSHELQIEENSHVTLLPPVFSTFMAKGSLFCKGLFNVSPCNFHLRELKSVFFEPKKAYRLFVSMLIARATMASKAYKQLKASLSPTEKTILYFYWGDNLCWIIPYVRKAFPAHTFKIVMRLHGSDLYEELKQNYAPLRKKIFESSDLLFTISEHGKNYLNLKYPEFNTKIQCSRLGVFDHGLNPFQAEATYTIVSASNMVDLKRIDLIFNVLQQSPLPITWYHFGDGPLLETIQNLIKLKRHNLNVHLMGFVTNEELITFYKTQSVDLFINLSTTEGLPVSIMEALSFGIPVIAPNIGGISELVNDTDGKLIPVHLDSKLISKELTQLLSSEDRMSVRKNARLCFEEKVFADSNYSDFYQRLNTL